jgi:hypothetical protein
LDLLDNGTMDFAAAARLPLDEQLVHFRAALERNKALMQVLEIAKGMKIPNW